MHRCYAESGDRYARRSCVVAKILPGNREKTAIAAFGERWHARCSEVSLRRLNEMETQRVAVEVVVSWDGNPLDTTVVREGALRIGQGAGSWFAVPSELMASSHELVLREAGAWIVSAPAGAEVRVAKSGTRIEPSPRVRLEPAMTVEVKIGRFAFFVRSTDAAIEHLPAAKPELRWTKWVGLAALLHVVMLGIFALSPPDAAALNIDGHRVDTRYVNVSLNPNERIEEPVQMTQENGGDPGESASSEGGEQGGGDATQVTEGSSPAPRRPGRNQPTFVVSDQTIDRLGTIAMLQAMSWGDDSSPYTAGNGHDGNGGLNDNASLLALTAGPGWGALRMDGHGHGTCDPRTQDCGAGIIGVGDLQTLDPGNDGNVPDLRDRGNGNGPGAIRMHPATTVGGLSREQVRRTVRTHINEVRFCYEQALQRRPDAEGRVAVTFMISPSGAVSSASASSTVSDAQVGTCVEQAVRRWTFPQSPSPTGVTYPFVMESSH
jgi:TonB family protein